MSNPAEEGVEIVIRQAPAAIRVYLMKLAKVCGYREPVEVALIAAADMPSRVGVTDNPHGFLHIVPGKVPLIVISDAYVDDPRWQSLIAHEFLHLLRWTTDWWVLTRLPENEHDHYLRLVENMMKPLSILLMVGGMINAEWVEEEPIL